MAEKSLLRESVWFDQAKFETAEARYQQVIAERHSALKVEGKAISKSSSAISTELEKAMNFIGQSLKAPPQSSTGKGDLEQRVGALEKENKELKAALFSIVSRVSALEYKSGVNQPSSEPTVSTNEDEKDDDFDLFGSDDENDNEEVEKLKQQRLQQYAAKKAKKLQVVAKSNIILDVKPWDDETDVLEMEKAVRSVSTDGLLWGASKLVPVAYGIKKLQITCVVEDDKVGTDFLEESITFFEDYVQSVDVVAFNKI